MNNNKFGNYYMRYLFFATSIFLAVGIMTISGCVTKSNSVRNLDNTGNSDLKNNSKNEFQRGLSIYYLNGFWRHMSKMYGVQYFFENGKMGKPVSIVDHRFGKGEIFDSGKTRGIGVQMAGYLKIDKPGEWYFRVNSNDGIEIFIDDEKILEDPSYHADRITDSGSVQIQTTGYHRLLLRYFQRKGTATLEFYWKPPGNTDFAIIPETAYWHRPVIQASGE